MIEFKALKYKHVREARKLSDDLAKGNTPDENLFEFIMGLVTAWDFLDAETGVRVQVGDLDNLTTDQLNELVAEFNAIFALKSIVPNPTASP